MITEVELGLCPNAVEVGHNRSIITLRAGRVKRRKHDRRENADDGDDDEKFDKSETLLFFHMFVFKFVFK
jgi:hypothetical protein